MLTIFILLLLVSLLIFTAINISFSVESIEVHPHKMYMATTYKYSVFQYHQVKHFLPSHNHYYDAVGRSNLVICKKAASADR